MFAGEVIVRHVAHVLEKDYTEIGNSILSPLFSSFYHFRNSVLFQWKEICIKLKQLNYILQSNANALHT